MNLSCFELVLIDIPSKIMHVSSLFLNLSVPKGNKSFLPLVLAKCEEVR